MDYEKKIREYLNSDEIDQLYKSMLINLFPEFTESKNERIRKEIISYIKNSTCAIPTERYKTWLAWLEKQSDSNKEYWRGYIEGKKEILDKYSELEKQGEQKPAWSEEDYNCLSIIIAEFLKCAGKSVSKDEWMRCNDFLNSLRDRVWSQTKQEWSKEDEEHIESVLKRLDGMCKKGATFTQTCFAVNQDMDWLKSIKDRVQPQTHHAWSEEDMNLLNRLIGVLNGTNKEDYHEAWEEKFLPWLKFLKDRVQPQPKQEWSEEDKKMSRFIGNAITVDEASMYLESKGIQVIDAHVWLDGLKDRVQPQNTWKPSDEQMLSLERASNSLVSTEDTVILRKLLNDLKKLREE